MNLITFAVLFLVSSPLLVSSMISADCSRDSISQCSPYFNETSCCRCRGNPLFMLDVGLKTGHDILVDVVSSLTSLVHVY